MAYFNTITPIAALFFLLQFLTFVFPTTAHLQVPLQVNTPPQTPWAFNFSSAAPHYFSSIHSLLRQWPQTYFPIGHTLAAAEIPSFTKLYHGRRDADPPPSPEWLAFDIEMSYGIMGSSRSSWMLTYATTRPVKVLYFDGESATLMGDGRMDTQMLAIFGNVTGPDFDNPGGFRGLWEEYLRANGLCDWMAEKGLRGRGWGFEGVVRMNAGFELIWCDFNSPSLRLISWTNVSAPLWGSGEEEVLTREKEADEAGNVWEKEVNGLVSARSAPTTYYPLPPSPTRSDRATDPSRPAQPPNWRRSDREPFLKSQGWGWYRSATRHYEGERRVKLHPCGVLNYYSPEFHSQAIDRGVQEQERLNLTESGLWNGVKEENFTQAALTQLLHRRRFHRLDAVTVTDATMMQNSTAAMLRDIVVGNYSCSGMDWPVILYEIVDTYASPLREFRLLLESGDNILDMNYAAVRSWLLKVRDTTHTFLLPFFEYPSNTTAPGIWSPESQLYADTFARCQFFHTRLLENMTLNNQESLLKWSVEETMSSICSTILKISFATEEMWAREFNEITDTSNLYRSANTKSEFSSWAQGVQELMAWLGWVDHWTRCERVCDWDEECYIPMWPLIHIDRRRVLRPPPGDGEGEAPPSGPVQRHSEERDGRRRHGRPGGGWWRYEKDLWEPRCVKAEYLMG